jgi:uncharacterized protein (DUF1684 family)|tara:strand:+ start:296 stop:892 length:597 start_codon:yes stop_codon:yes gene_type:complete
LRGIVPLILISIFLSIAYYLYNSTLEYEQYSIILDDYRQERNDFLNNSSSSPLKGSGYKLSYYDPNVNFKVIAVVSENENTDTITLATSTGSIERFLDFADLSFKLGRSKYSLPVYKYLEGVNKGDLFFCFLDKTNSTSTYPGGRYIDIEFENAKRIELDFNKSYNPYCVYNEEYSCPIPSSENYIDMEILAGEKLTK